jgi:metallo-beta-lactamase class B
VTVSCCGRSRRGFGCTPRRFNTPRFGLTPANGLLVVADTEALLVDAGWSDAQAEALLDWAADSGRRRLRGASPTRA